MEIKFTEELRELVLLCLNNLGICYWHIWMTTYPYHGSYAHYNNPDIDFGNFYYVAFFFAIGGLASSYVSVYYN